MSIINLGNQTVTFDFKQPLQGKEFNKLLRGIVKHGIYQGGAVSFTTTGGISTITIAAFQAAFNVSTDKVVNVKTSTGIILTCGQVSGPQSGNDTYLIMRYIWDDVIDNYIDFVYENAATYTPLTTDIIVCTITYTTYPEIASLSTSSRTSGLYDTDYNVIIEKILKTDTITERTTGSGIGIGGTVFKVDQTNHRIGINNISPTYTLDVDGTLNVTGTGIIGGLTVGGSLLSTASTTFTLLSTPTTINFGAGATIGINIGNTISGTILIQSPLQSNAYNEGALKVLGGGGFTKNLNVGGTINKITMSALYGGSLVYSNNCTLTISGNGNISGTISGSNTGDITLATNHGLSLAAQVIGMGTPSTITYNSINSVTTTTHTHTVSGLTNVNLSEAAGITNAKLANSSITIGTTTISLGGSSTTLGGLTSISSGSCSLTGALTIGASGNFALNGTAFTIASNGNTSISGTLTTTGLLTANGGISVGATTISSSLTIAGNVNVGASTFLIDSPTGNTTIAGALSVPTATITTATITSLLGNFANSTNYFWYSNVAYPKQNASLYRCAWAGDTPFIMDGSYHHEFKIGNLYFKIGIAHNYNNNNVNYYFATPFPTGIYANTISANTSGGISMVVNANYMKINRVDGITGSIWFSYIIIGY